MKAMVTKLSCDKLAQVISIKHVDGNWRVELMETKNLLEVKCHPLIFECVNYEMALNRYISLVEEQARHIALMSL